MPKEDIIKQNTIKQLKNLENERRHREPLNDFYKHYFPLMRNLLVNKLRHIGPSLRLIKLNKDAKHDLQVIENLDFTPEHMSTTNVSSSINRKVVYNKANIAKNNQIH